MNQEKYGNEILIFSSHLFTAKEMVLERILGLMVMSMKENGSKIKSMVKVLKKIQQANDMKDIILMARKRASENLPGLMVHSMKENGSIIKDMVKVLK